MAEENDADLADFYKDIEAVAADDEGAEAVVDAAAPVDAPDRAAPSVPSAPALPPPPPPPPPPPRAGGLLGAAPRSVIFKPAVISRPAQPARHAAAPAGATSSRGSGPSLLGTGAPPAAAAAMPPPYAGTGGSVPGFGGAAMPYSGGAVGVTYNTGGWPAPTGAGAVASGRYDPFAAASASASSAAPAAAAAAAVATLPSAHDGAAAAGPHGADDGGGDAAGEAAAAPLGIFAAAAAAAVPRVGVKRKHARTCAGETWVDPTLSEWPENDYRLFCGDLGNEVGDDGLAAPFRKFKSFAKARVVREAKSHKSRGYGFVSFTDPLDALAAMKEVHGKYIGNRPVRIKRSTWDEKDTGEVKRRERDEARRLAGR